MGFFGLFRRERPGRDQARSLYVAVVEQARRPEFYLEFGVADTPDGRFDLVALHAFLVFRRLKGEGEAAQALAQATYDLMFADMDTNLRELGVSDIAIGRRMKGLTEAFQGRVAAYGAALEADDRAALAAALGRNLFRKNDPTAAQVAAVAGYVVGAARHLAGQPPSDLLAGRVTFGALPKRGGGEDG